MSDDLELDGFRLMQRDLERAISNGSEPAERFVRVGDHAARFCFLSEELADRMTPAFSHLLGGDADDPSLTVHIWDSASTDTRLSPLLRAVIDGAGYDSLTPRMEVKVLTSDLVRTSIVPWHGITTMLDVRARRAIYWVDDVAEIPYHELGAPFRTLFSWWLSEFDLHCVHAGAVGSPDGAVLLTGRSGSGKSTSALACLGTDLQYLADDYCVVALSPEMEVLSLYNTAKLVDRVDLQRQPRFTDWIVNLEQVGDEKAMMFLHSHVPDQLLDRAPLKAVLAPQVTGRERPLLERISGAEALRALAPTSLFQLPGTGQGSLTRLATLARALPCYSMQTGPDLAAIPSLIGDLLSALGTGDVPDRLGG